MSAVTFRYWLVVVVTLLAVSLAGCQQQKEQQQLVTEEFVLPAGDAELGKAAFFGMRCYDCHRIPGVEMPPGEELNQAVVVLGGDTSKVKDYKGLVTSIINPSHKLAKGYAEGLVARDGQSNMTNYNDAMTVAELINIVAFLQPHYDLKAPDKGE